MPNSQSAKRKVKIGQITPVVILAVSVVGALYFKGFFNSSISVTTPTPASVLTPTRDIAGTWQTTFSTKFNIATDSSSNQFSDVGSENRTMTWMITATSQENIVNVKVEFIYSNRQLMPDSGYTPDVSPVFLTGTINATQLTLTTPDSGPIKQIGSVGAFTFTAGTMVGTWHDHWSGVYEQNVYTPTDGLKLAKQ